MNQHLKQKHKLKKIYTFLRKKANYEAKLFAE